VRFCGRQKHLLQFSFQVTVRTVGLKVVLEHPTALVEVVDGRATIASWSTHVELALTAASSRKHIGIINISSSSTIDITG